MDDLDVNYTIELTVTNGYQSVKDSFGISLMDKAPEFDSTIDNLQTQFDSQVPNPQLGKPMTFSAVSPFTDPDHDLLTYTAEYYDTNSSQYLPLSGKWLSFTSQIFIFKGTCKDVKY